VNDAGTHKQAPPGNPGGAYNMCDMKIS
jgi:hypothetical protein